MPQGELAKVERVGQGRCPAYDVARFDTQNPMDICRVQMSGTHWKGWQRQTHG